MLDVVEDSRNEFKEILNDKLEKEVVGFLNSDGGNIYIGVNNKGKIVGVDDTDKIQLNIKNRIKDHIYPSAMGLFDIEVKSYSDKKYIQIIIAAGNEIPYYIKKNGMNPNGCFKRIGSSTEQMTEKQIEESFSRRTRNSLKMIKSPNQRLSFSQLKIFYEEKGFEINDNFLNQLGLIMEDGNYNYLAYLLADDNDIPIQVATYSGSDVYDLIENEDYGYCSLIKSAKNVLNKFEQINKTYTKITYDDRKEVKMFDYDSIKEAVINAFVHNLWERETPPKFEIFNNHISITSTGGLPLHMTKQDFLKGYSSPTHPELMRIFKDLDLVEQLGTGIRRILKNYDESVYEFSDNFIRVNFKFRSSDDLPYTPRKVNSDNNIKIDMQNIEASESLSETQKAIINLIEDNNKITQQEMADKLSLNRSTIMRNLRYLKENRIIERVGSDREGYWKNIER